MIQMEFCKLHVTAIMDEWWKSKKFNPSECAGRVFCVLFGSLLETLLGRADICFFKGVVKGFAKCWGCPCFVHVFFCKKLLWISRIRKFKVLLVSVDMF